MNTFWDCDDLQFEDLPTVRELIGKADREVLAREIARHLGICPSESKMASIKMSLENMTSVRHRKASSKWVFFPLDFYSYCHSSEKIGWQLDAALLRRSDFSTIEELSKQEELLYSAQECMESRERNCNRFGACYPDLHSWGFRSWPKVLSFRVWLGGEYGMKERYRVLAVIIAEMLELGSTWEEVRDVRRGIRQVGLATNPNEPHIEYRAIPTELITRDFGLKPRSNDHAREHEKRKDDIVLVMNHNASVDLHRRVVDLMRRMRCVERRSHMLQGAVISVPCEMTSRIRGGC